MREGCAGRNGRVRSALANWPPAGQFARLNKEDEVATNTGRGSRVGAVRQRSQTFNPLTRTWTKRGPNGQFMDGKSGGQPFKGVTKEKN
jgi:hypothetical protein